MAKKTDEDDLIGDIKRKPAAPAKKSKKPMPKKAAKATPAKKPAAKVAPKSKKEADLIGAPRAPRGRKPLYDDSVKLKRTKKETFGMRATFQKTFGDGTSIGTAVNRIIKAGFEQPRGGEAAANPGKYLRNKITVAVRTGYLAVVK